MAAVYAGDVVNAILLKLGVLGPGEVAKANDAATVLKDINDLMDAWNCQLDFVYNENFFQSTLIPNLQPTLIGPSGSAGFIVPVRPVFIKSANVLLQQSSNPPIRVPLDIWNDDQWNSEAIPSLAQTQPTALYYSPAWSATSPNGQLYFWPIPQIAYGIEIRMWNPLPQFSGLAGTANVFSLPPGYRDAIQWECARRLQSTYGQTLSQDDLTTCRKAVAAIKVPNTQSLLITTDLAGIQQNPNSGSLFNWTTRSFTR